MAVTDTQKNKQLFEEAPVLKAVVALEVPTVISQLITVVYNMADTYFVGQTGDPNQVAAASICLPLFMVLTGMANLFGIGGASLSLARLVLMYFDDLHSGYIRGSGLYEIDPQAELLYQRACLGPSIRKMKSTKETYQNARKEVYRAWVPGYEEVDDTAFYYF